MKEKALLAAALLILAAPLSAAPEDKYFRRAIQALDRKEFAEAEHELRTVLQIDSQESRRKIAITSGRFEWYLPHYFLGLSLLSQGDLPGAYEAWSVSREQKVVFGWRDFERFDRAWSELEGSVPARSRPVPPPPPPPPVSPAKELENLLEEARKALATAGPAHFRSVSLFVAVGDAMSVARLELGRNQLRPADLAKRRDALRQALAALAGRPADRRTGDDLSADLIELCSRVRALGSGEAPAAEVKAALEELDLELRKNLPSRELLLRDEKVLLQAAYPQAFP